MYQDITKQERTKGYFLDAITAAKDKGKSKYFKRGLSLLGTYLDSDFIELTQVLAEPQLEVILEDDIGITLNIKLKPESREDPTIDLLGLVLEATSTGMFMEPVYVDDEELKQNKMLKELSNIMLPAGVTGFEEDPLVTLFFDKDSVNLQKFKVLGEQYYLFTLTERALLDEEEYEHTLYVMFKDKDSSHETFFSPLVGHKLDMRVTHRMLQGFADKNITGMFIGGVVMFKEGLRVETFAVTNTTTEYDNIQQILKIRTHDTRYSISLSKIDSSEVKVNDAGKYTVILYMEDGLEIYIYIG